jgi:hypothetical protein
VADPEQQAALIEVAFPPERDRAVRAVILGSALGLVLSLAAWRRRSPVREGDVVPERARQPAAAGTGIE